MVCKQCLGFGVRHIQLLLLFSCVMVGTILESCQMAAVRLARGTSEDTSTYYEDRFKIEVESRSEEEIIWLDCCIYYVLFITRFASGVMSCRLNNKAAILIIMLLASIQSYSIPSLAQKYGWPSLIAMRFISGLIQGLTMPVIYQIASKWSPYTEAARCVGFIKTAPFCGRFFTAALGGFIGRSIGGWTSVFYIAGNLGILWVVAWFTFGSDNPRNCFYISLDEKYYIERNSYDIDTLLWETAIPWKKMFTTRSIYIAMSMALLTYWADFFYSDAFFASYILTVFNFTEENVSMIIYYATAFIIVPVMIPVAIFSDLINNKEKYPVIHQRKTCSSIGYFGSAVSIVFLGYASKSYNFIIACYYFIVATQPFVFVSYSLLPFDIAPNFAGLIYAIMTALGSLPIILLPKTIATVVSEKSKDTEWDHMLYLTALSYFSANFIYIILYKGKLESYNNISPVFTSSSSPSSRGTNQFDINVDAAKKSNSSSQQQSTSLAI